MANVEVQINTEIYRRALATARGQGISLAAVARMIVFQAQADAEALAAKTGPPDTERVGRLPLREYGTARQIMRFVIPDDKYAAARSAIATSGRTVSATVEDGLERYATARAVN